jgi:hypothetical protein
MTTAQKCLIFLTALLTAFILCVFFFSDHAYVIKIITKDSPGFQLLNKNWVIEPDSDGIVHFSIFGRLNDATIKKIIFEIQPDQEHKYYQQGNGYDVNNHEFIGNAQLGSHQYPMKKRQHYLFKIISEDGKQILSKGEIEAIPYYLLTKVSFLLTFLPLLSAGLTILTFICKGHPKTT